MKRSLKSLILCALALVQIHCSSSQMVVTPGGRVFIPTGKQTKQEKPPTITTFTSRKRLKEIGAEQHEEIKSKYKFYQDQTLLEYVDRVGQKVAAVSDAPEIGYQFYILDSDGINAFAAPGGYIYVTRGLLALFNTEDQLASVLGHEVAHVAANHHARQGNRKVLGKGAEYVTGIATVLTTGSSIAAEELADLSSLWASAATAGFGRELELEADGLSAQYLKDAGYDSYASFESLSLMKDFENFVKRTLGGGGAYHGSFASHPRTDKRLQEIIGIAESTDRSDPPAVENQEFREAIDGLVWGQNAASLPQDRYYQELLGYTMRFPEAWDVSETTTTATASHPAMGALDISARRRLENIEPLEYLKELTKGSDLTKSEPLNINNLIGHTGVVTSESGNRQRIAVIYFGPRAFIFNGEIMQGANAELIDKVLLDSIRSFRAIQVGETLSGSVLRVRYVQASEYFDFAEVAKSSPIPEHAEEFLRLFNGYYPRGTPEAGEWVKLVE